MQHWYTSAVAIGALALNASAFGQDTTPAQITPSTSSSPSPAVVSSHQIDRYEAIKQLNASLKADPNNLADWVILGELAQEVAVEGPANQAQGYFRLARQAYESALKLAPDNAGLKAAAQFARDQETNADQFNTARTQATTSYLSTRRNEISQSSQPVPTLRVYNTPTPAAAPANATAPNQAAYPYGAPLYRPYDTNDGQPYTYQQYNNGFFGSNQPNPLNTNPTNTNPNVNPNPLNNANTQPMTLRQYTQQLPSVLGNEAIRRIAPGAATPAAGGAIPPAAGAAVTPR